MQRTAALDHGRNQREPGSRALTITTQCTHTFEAFTTISNILLCTSDVLRGVIDGELVVKGEGLGSQEFPLSSAKLR